MTEESKTHAETPTPLAGRYQQKGSRLRGPSAADSLHDYAAADFDYRVRLSEYQGSITPGLYVSLLLATSFALLVAWDLGSSRPLAAVCDAVVVVACLVWPWDAFFTQAMAFT